MAKQKKNKKERKKKICVMGLVGVTLNLCLILSLGFYVNISGNLSPN